MSPHPVRWNCEQVFKNFIWVTLENGIILKPAIMVKPGRNDPCHCGSGKKYKKCHLDSDLRHQPEAHPSPACTPELPSLPRAKIPLQAFRRLAGRGPARVQKEFAELFDKATPLFEYLERQAEIEGAEAKLNERWAEFEELIADGNRLADCAEALFAEECFTELRFSASDVRSAFDHVGHPGTLVPDNETAKILRAAILHVADPERRCQLAMRLLLLLPQFVASGRYLDACLLQSVALETAEDQHESNPFLFQMFSYGYDALAAEKSAKNDSLLRQIGFDPERLRGMSLNELDEWMNSLAADPAQTAAMEAFFRENPNLREESIANLQAMERNAARLLDREDTRFLLLPPDEVLPWVPGFNEILQQAGFVPQAQETALDKDACEKILMNFVLPRMREMAAAIFTPDRIRRLVADLKRYRSERFAAGDKETAMLATGAINYLEREDSPGENGFLLNLCFHSFGQAANTAPDETGCTVE